MDHRCRSVIDKILKNGCVTMVIGQVDTGKSTFCRRLASIMLEKGFRVGIVDSDVGQSWIGPPTTIGMKIFDSKPTPTLFPDSLYFTGSITPERHLLETVTGAKHMVEAAISAGAERVVVDTTGLISGGVGRILKSSKIDLIKPDHIICLQRNSELEILVRGFDPVYRVHRLEPSRSVRKKSQNSRRAYRQKKFNEYFSRCESCETNFSELRGQRSIFLNGRRANDAELENLSDIVGDLVIYAEWSFRGLFIVTGCRISDMTIRKLRGQLKINELSIKTPESFQRMVVCLMDGQGESVCLAVIEEVDFNRGILRLRCGKSALDRVKAIQFSDFRLSR